MEKKYFITETLDIIDIYSNPKKYKIKKEKGVTYGLIGEYDISEKAFRVDDEVDLYTYNQALDFVESIKKDKNDYWEYICEECYESLWNIYSDSNEYECPKCGHINKIIGRKK